MRRASPLLLLPLLLGCPQQVVVYADAAVTLDSGASTPDSGTTTTDGGTTDDAGTTPTDAGSNPDAGEDPCGALPFCLDVTAEPARANVRETVTVQTELTNPSNLTLRVELCDEVPRARRAANRPALDLGEIGYVVQPQLDPPGSFTFIVTEVPPWFVATDFGFEVCVFEDGGTTPSLRVPVEVHVRGNVLISAQYQGVFAVASDGRPATGKAGAYPEAKLLDDTITRAAALRLASDGTLLVLDPEARPARIARYALDGPDVRLGSLAHLAEDLGGAEPIYYDNVAIYSLAEMPDGAIALADTHNSGTSTPRAMIWNPDGTFRREVRGGDVNQEWRSVAARATDELLIGMSYNIVGHVIRVDPLTGVELTPRLTGDVRKWIFALEPMPDGRVVVGSENLVLIAGDGGAAVTVTGLPGGGTRDWRAITLFDGKILVANDHQGDSGNVAVVDGRSFERWFRVAGSGGPVIVPYGLAYLE